MLSKVSKSSIADAFFLWTLSQITLSILSQTALHPSSHTLYFRMHSPKEMA